MTQTADTVDTDALVVGAGPTGLTMASELLRRGLRVRLIDSNDAPTTLSKAIAVHARTLEIFDDLGIADEIIANGVKLTGGSVIANGEKILSFDLSALDTRFAYVLSISQIETERLLSNLVIKRGGTIERKTRLARLQNVYRAPRALHALTDIGERSDWVLATLETAAGEETIRAHWVLGCDGAHSTVRKALGVTFEGHSYDEVFVLADVKVECDLPRDRISTFFAADGIAACFPMKDDRWRVILTAPSDVVAGTEPTLAGVQDCVSRRAHKELKMSDVAWIAPFHIHCRQTNSYRKGRVFLSGDAAHIHSPVGGQGMNTGIQDAHNLAWKLALVHQGKGREVLLESYEKERHAVGQALLRTTDIATKLGTLQGNALTSIRNQIARFATSFEPVKKKIADNVSELTVGYDESPLNGEHTSSLLKARIGEVAAAETPTVGTRLEFRGGPGPGARAPDALLKKSGDTQEMHEMRLSKLLSGDVFTLLLFDGRNASKAGYASFVKIAASMRDAFGDDVIRSMIVTPVEDRPAEIPSHVVVLHDHKGELEERYGAKTECVYLIRPDFYVGFRSQPADESSLMQYLGRLLVQRADRGRK